MAFPSAKDFATRGRSRRRHHFDPFHRFSQRIAAKAHMHFACDAREGGPYGGFHMLDCACLGCSRRTQILSWLDEDLYSRAGPPPLNGLYSVLLGNEEHWLSPRHRFSVALWGVHATSVALPWREPSIECPRGSKTQRLDVSVLLLAARDF